MVNISDWQASWMYPAISAQRNSEKELSHQSDRISKTLPHQFEVSTKKKKEEPEGLKLYDWSYLLKICILFRTKNLINLLCHITDVSLQGRGSSHLHCLLPLAAQPVTGISAQCSVHKGRALMAPESQQSSSKHRSAAHRKTGKSYTHLKSFKEKTDKNKALLQDLSALDSFESTRHTISTQGPVTSCVSVKATNCGYLSHSAFYQCLSDRFPYLNWEATPESS